MSHNNRPSPPWVRALAFVFFLCVGAAAQSYYDSAKKARQADGGQPTWYLTGLTGNHSTTSATAVDLQYVQGGDQTLRLNLRGSGSAATGTIEVWGSTLSTGVLEEIIGKQTFTLGTDNRATGGYQPNTPLYFDIAAYTAYDVRCTVLSAGTLDIKAVTLGAASYAAE